MTDTYLMDAEFGELLSRLPAGLDLDASARTSGALVRRRGARDAASLLRLALGYGACGLSLRGAAAWAEISAVARLSDVALLNRLRGAADWLGEIVAAVLSQRMVETVSAGGGRRVRLVDATTLSCSGSRQTDWRVHVGFRLGPRPRIEQLQLSDGRGAESLGRFVCGPGDIVIGDAGHAKARDLARFDATGAAFIIRTGWNAVRLRTPDGAPFNLFAVLKGVPERGRAEVGAAIALDRAGTQLLPVRLVILGKSAEEAARARDRARRKSRKQGKTPRKETLQAAGHIMLLSSLDGIDFPAGDVLEFHRLRRQIELVFKRLKSLLHLDRLPARDPDLARCWIYAKIIAALLLEDMSGHVVDSPQGCTQARRGQPHHGASSACRLISSSSPPSSGQPLTTPGGQAQNASTTGSQIRQDDEQANSIPRDISYVSAYGLNTRLHLAVDGHGLPVRMIVAGGNMADCTQAEDLIDGLVADHLMADKACGRQGM